MRNIVIILILVVILGIIGGTIYVFNLRSRSTTPEPTRVVPTAFFPTPTLYRVFPSTKPLETNPIGVMTVIPQNEQQNVALNTQVIITFTQNINPDDITLFIVPEVPFTKTASGKVLTLTFGTPLQPGTVYSYAFTHRTQSNLPLTYSFTTVGPTPTTLPDTRNAEFFKERREYELQNNPDVYVAGYVPYDASTFSISRARVYNKDYYYQFTVTMKNPQTAKVDAEAWLKSLQLTEAQVKQLDIVYK